MVEYLPASGATTIALHRPAPSSWPVSDLAAAAAISVCAVASISLLIVSCVSEETSSSAKSISASSGARGSISRLRITCTRPVGDPPNSARLLLREVIGRGHHVGHRPRADQIKAPAQNSVHRNFTRFGRPAR